jgi:hypothetical protein
MNIFRASLCTGLVALGSILSAAVHADSSTRLDATILIGYPTGFYFQQAFSCFGTPTCTGVFNVTERDDGCSNTFNFQGAITLTGIDLSHAGSFSGAVELSNDSRSSVNGDGTCSYSVRSSGRSGSYTGTWTGTGGTLFFTFTDSNGQTKSASAPFVSNAAPPPVFPMTVTATVTPTVASANATFQPRPQDVGKLASIFVFAHAPSTLVSGPGAKAAGPTPIPAKPEDAVVCVLAQVTSDGRLIAVSASNMQAYLSGVLGGQNQAVQLLNNVATANVLGATIFVGYGSSAAAMFASGVYQSAVTVPGPVQCTASLASAPAPNSPGALSGLWWNAAESGWGIHFTQRGVNLFAAWYTYGAQGNPKWYVAPNCAFATSAAVSGTCTSALYDVAGTAFFGHDFNPALVHANQVGTLQLAFQNTNGALMTYTVGSQSRTVPIVRQVFPVAATSAPAVDFTDLWWNPNESGWGMAIAHQFGNVFLAWYVYDASGKPFWYVAPSCTVSGSSCSGALYRTTAPAFGPPLDPTKVQAFAVGSALVSFVDANNAVLSFTVDGTTSTKTIMRQLF